MKEMLVNTMVIERNGYVVVIDNTGSAIEIFDSYDEYVNWFNNLD